MNTYFSHFVKTKRGSFKMQMEEIKDWEHSPAKPFTLGKIQIILRSSRREKMYTSVAGRKSALHRGVRSAFRHFPAEIEVADWSLSRTAGPEKKKFGKHFWKWILTFVSICSFTANHHSMASGNDLTDSIVSNDDLLNTALLYAKYW